MLLGTVHHLKICSRTRLVISLFGDAALLVRPEILPLHIHDPQPLRLNRLICVHLVQEPSRAPSTLILKVSVHLGQVCTIEVFDQFPNEGISRIEHVFSADCIGVFQTISQR